MISRAPYVLFARGATSFLARPMQDLVTVTGSRAASAYGEHVAAELAGDLANDERVLVAGGTYGVEAAAHCAALSAGGDAIVGPPVAWTAPTRTGNRDLLDRVGDVGALVSELPLGSAPHAASVPGSLPTAGGHLSRNGGRGGRRTIGGMRVTAEARQFGRGVGAVPGPVASATSHGPH